MRRGRLALFTAGFVAAGGAAGAQTAGPVANDAVAPEQITVVGASPLMGAGLDRNQIPAATNVLSSKDIDRTNIPSLTGAILDNIPSASLNDVEGNPFQPDILFRGFIASPVAGTNEGLAVYVNGARFNDPFGDTVNWDLIPSVAIGGVNVEASNPVFGLNALGGSVNVQLKNGFDFHGGDLTAYGGSYARGAGSLEYGQQVGNFAIYAAGEISNDNGFRDTQQSQIYRLYTDLGWRGDLAEIHLNVIAADNTLGNPGAAPVQELDQNIAYIATAPNEVYNKYVAVNLNGNVSLNDTTTLQGLAYFQNLTQRVPNGTTVDVANCGAADPGYLCNDDGSVVTGRNGVPVLAFEPDNVYSGLSTQGLDSHAYGGSVQVTNDADMLGLKNHVVGGASFDGSDSVFEGSSSIGGFDPYTFEYIGPGVVQDQPGEGINPVRVASVTRYYGLFGQDIWTIARGLAVSVGGRFNNAEIDLHDKLGGPVTGQHSYNRFNPTAGLTYRVAPALQFYGSYSETNRAPTPQELSCASAANPCTLLSFFVGDPNLKQVVSRTFELGARGTIARFGDGKFGWNADYFHTKDHDDLIYETTDYNAALAYYTNAGQTLRQGVEANLHYDTPVLHVVLGYTYTDATFQSPLLLGSDANPGADANGNIHVVPGDRIPDIARHRGTVVVTYNVTPAWTFGGNAVLQSSQYRVGDEANLSKPVGGYMVVDLNTAYRITDSVTIFGVANNVFNERYATYGAFADFTGLPFPQVPGGTIGASRTASPGMPIAGYGGVKVSF